MENDPKLGNPARRIEIKKKAGKCTYLSCEKQSHAHDLCQEHHWEMTENIRANDAIAILRFCRRGNLDRQKIARAYGLSSKFVGKGVNI